MKKIISAILVFIAMSIQTTFSQEKKAEPFIELQPGVSLGKNSQGIVRVHGGATWKVNDGVSLGFGAGVSSSFKFDATPGVPVFFRTKIDLSQSEMKPFAMLDMGYHFNFDNFDMGTVLISPTVGVKYGSYYLGVNYEASIPTTSGLSTGNALFAKLGYAFGRNQTPKIIKNSFVNLEIGGACGLSSKKYYHYGYYYKHTGLGTEAFARLSWMFPTADNLYIGIGSGVDVFFPNDEQLVSIPIYLRPLYYFNIPQISTSLQPYVSCDLGYKIADRDGNGFRGFMFEPQVGILLNKCNIGIAYHHTTYEVGNYEEDTCGASGLALHLGYRF